MSLKSVRLSLCAWVTTERLRGTFTCWYSHLQAFRLPDAAISPTRITGCWSFTHAVALRTLNDLLEIAQGGPDRLNQLSTAPTSTASWGWCACFVAVPSTCPTFLQPIDVNFFSAVSMACNQQKIGCHGLTILYRNSCKMSPSARTAGCYRATEGSLLITSPLYTVKCTCWTFCLSSL